jgi:hypothetical protein
MELVFRKIASQATLGDPAAHARVAGSTLLITVNEIRDYLKHENAIPAVLLYCAYISNVTPAAQFRGNTSD